MSPDQPQSQLDAVFDAYKERQADDVFAVLERTLSSTGFEDIDRHRVYEWAEEISAGIRPEA